MKRKTEAFRRLARALDQLAVQVFRDPTIGPSEIMARCEEVQASFLGEFHKSEKAALEVRRRVVERQLTLLIDRSVDVAVIEPTVAQLYELGFAGMERRATFELALADYYAKQGLLEKARALVQELHDDLSRSLEERASVLYKEFKERAATVLQRLEM
jgi:hypothetical protein